MTITLRHLEILRALANNRSLTLAAKQLGLSQPSLSQQLSKLEGDIGQRLVDRTAKGLHLTDAGCFLLAKAEPILSMVEEAEVGLGQFECGLRGQLTIGALTSLARSLVTPASIELKRRFPDIQLNVVELSPETVVHQLQSRRVQIALISSVMGSEQTRHFTKVELTSDPYVLAVPKGPDGKREPLSRSVIMVDFGSTYQNLVSGWYRRIIPEHKEVARCRTHELALTMVEAGLGVAIVPM
ncbi:MAG: LysR family transcriptional regulator, partial [Geminicoccaceae bacterium]